MLNWIADNTTFLLGIAGTLAMLLLGVYLPTAIKRRHEANAAFRSAFLPAITRLEVDPGGYKNILNEEFRNHEKAAVAFMQIIRIRKSRFKKTWEEYKQYAISQVDIPILAFLSTEVTDLEKSNDPLHIKEVAEMRKQECLNHIYKLMKFARF